MGEFGLCPCSRPAHRNKSGKPVCPVCDRIETVSDDRARRLHNGKDGVPPGFRRVNGELRRIGYLEDYEAI